MGDPVTLALLVGSGALASSALKGPRSPKQVSTSMVSPEIVGEQSEEAARLAAKRRRGLGSTILTGETPTAGNLQKKTLLGS